MRRFTTCFDLALGSICPLRARPTRWRAIGERLTTVRPRKTASEDLVAISDHTFFLASAPATRFTCAHAPDGSTTVSVATSGGDRATGTRVTPPAR